jgi:hypothetical protein
VTATDNAAFDRIDVTIPGAVAGAGQTPWLQDIDASGFKLNKVGGIGIGPAVGAQSTIGIFVDGTGFQDGFRQLNASPSGAPGCSFQNDLGTGLNIRVYGSARLPANIAVIETFGPLAFIQNSAEAMRLDIAGRVGIGKIPSAYRLEVAGDVDVTGTYRVNGVPLAVGVSSVFGRSGAVVAASADYTAAQVTNAVSTIGSYADPAWITALAYAKITGAPAAGGGQTPWLQDINAATFKLNNSGGIGIGVASPTQALHVAKADNNDVILVSGSSTSVYMAFQSNATSGRITHFNGSAWGNILLAPFGGKVGIGIPATINYPLDVVGDVNISAGSVYRINGVPLSTGVPTSRQVIAGTGMSGGGALTADVTLNALPMIASGATGRGGTVPTPGATAGTTKFLREDATWGVPVGAAQTPWLSDIDAAGFSLNNATQVVVANLGANIGFLTGMPTECRLASSTNKTLRCQGTPLILDGLTYVAIQTNSPLTEKMRITAAGYVGIGQSVPVRSLHVGNVPLGGGMVISGGAPNLMLSSVETEPNTGPMGVFFGMATAAGHFALPNAGDCMFGTQGTSRGDLYLSANYQAGDSSKKLLLQATSSGGAVGIGTTNLSTAKLVVQATIDRVLVVRGDPTPFGFPPAMLGPILAGVSSDHSTFEPFTIAGQTINLMIGKVGINTTAPAYQLDVVGDCNITGQYLVNGVPLSTGGGSQTPWLTDIQAAAYGLYNAGVITVLGSGTWEGYRLDVHSAGGQAARFRGEGNVYGMTVMGTGKVGIGTDNPPLKLSIIGGATGYGDPVLGTAIGTLAVLPSDTGWGMLLGARSDGTGWIQQQRIDTQAIAYTLALNPVGGNVGIGTYNATSKLTVDGGPLEMRSGQPIYFRRPDNGYHYYMAVSAATLLQVASGGGPVGINMDTNGLVAIGISAVPYQRLSVLPAVTITSFAAAGLQMRIGESSNNGAYGLGLGFCYINSIWSSVLQTAPAPGPMFINPLGGNVAIGGIGGMLASQPTWVNPTNPLMVIPTTNPTAFGKASQQLLLCESSANPGYGMAMGYGINYGSRYCGAIQSWENNAVSPLYLNPAGGNVIFCHSGVQGPDFNAMPLGSMMIYLRQSDNLAFFYFKRSDSHTYRFASLNTTSS